MSLTVLFDLDDTLLGNDIDTFLPLYLRALGKHMSPFLAPELLVKELLAATAVMLANDTPVRTLETAFDSAFYPAIGQEKEAMRPVLEAFYGEVYPALRSATTPNPAAAEVVRQAKAQGHTLAVATNPLFPESAIRQRIEWAGLDPADFALITTYERMHFAKPNPAYLAEILAQLGWSNQPAVMIGNSLQDDLLPAAVLGMPVYWVAAAEAPLPQNLPAASGIGDLSGVTAWLASVEASPDGQGSALPAGSAEAATSAAAPLSGAPTFSPPALLAMLKATAAAYDTLSRNLTRAQWSRRPTPDAWNATVIAAHLCDVEREINLARVQSLLENDNPFVAGINADTWAEERGYAQYEPGPALFGYLTARAHLIEQLQTLTPEGWQRTARHAIFGPTTLQELVSFMVTHDRAHLQQFKEAAGA